MKERKKQRIWRMTSLYMNYAFQKTTVFIFGLSLILIAGILFFMSNPWLTKEEYALAPLAYHTTYMTQGLFILEIFNGILVTTIVITLILQSASFDSLFISYTKRSVICISKVFASAIFFLVLALFEYVVLYLYPILFYSEFQMKKIDYMLILYLFLTMLFDCSLSMLLATLVPSIFTPMVILFISIVKNLLCSSFTDIKESIQEFLPILSYSNSRVSCEAFILLPFWILIAALSFFTIYSIKDLKQS